MTTTADFKVTTIKEVDKHGVTVRLAGESDEKMISWDLLRDASQDNGALTEYYSDLLKRANARALQALPVAIMYGYVNTNVFGTYGQAINGEIYPIRHFDLSYWPMTWVAADEGIDLYSWESAKQEAEDIAARFPNLKLPVMPHPGRQYC